ncbi:hypothetical protein CLV68_2218 [Actinokineospora cianjurensis]|uniref:Uncharacterized protein n=1 Tax=Actinokineospora cianjurensis TaxID=585224 RepID=A0A421BBE8_9PSEU|nr:hypothetical protein CLV68_2218 [Actinokineospora cianjurensis]
MDGWQGCGQVPVFDRSSARSRRSKPIETQRRWPSPGLHDRWPNVPLYDVGPNVPSQTLAQRAPLRRWPQRARHRRWSSRAPLRRWPTTAPLRRWPTTAPRIRWCQAGSMGRTCFVWGDGTRSVAHRGRACSWAPALWFCPGVVGAPRKTSSPHRAKLETRAPANAEGEALTVDAAGEHESRNTLSPRSNPPQHPPIYSLPTSADNPGRASDRPVDNPPPTPHPTTDLSNSGNPLVCRPASTHPPRR